MEGFRGDSVRRTRLSTLNPLPAQLWPQPIFLAGEVPRLADRAYRPRRKVPKRPLAGNAKGLVALGVAAEPFFAALPDRGNGKSPRQSYWPVLLRATSGLQAREA